MEQYLDAVFRALNAVRVQLSEWALPLSIAVGALALAGAAVLAFRRDDLQRLDFRSFSTRVVGGAIVSLIVVICWAGLRAANPVARQAIEWRESATATLNPVGDAPGIYQYGPSIASVKEKTYTRTLTLPPDFLERVGEQGIGVLSPYLSDPSAENVLKLVDNFRRSGRDVVFTRQVTRLDEEPLTFESSKVSTRFQRLAGRSYDLEFEGRYLFNNDGSEPITARFQFPLPQEGTIRDISVQIGTEPVPEQNDARVYEWKAELPAGERREAVVHYHVTGGRTWNYDLGSQRRRVKQFVLDAVPNGAVRFMRGSLQPASTQATTLHWELGNVVTAQQVALAFPPDIAGRDGFLQALRALPASLALFLAGILVLGLWRREMPRTELSAIALVVFALGLGSAAVLANYVGTIAAVIAAPVLGALLATRVLGRAIFPIAITAALLPAAFLSADHSGLIILVLLIVGAAGLRRITGAPPRNGADGEIGAIAEGVPA
jgi:hypothetical protein